MSNTSLLFTIFAIDKATPTTGKVGSAIDKLALGIGVAATAIAVKTTMMAANFQTSMLKLRTSAGESAGNMKLVSSGVLDLATKTGDSATSLASALYTVESGGQHGAAGLLVLKAAAQGAKAEGADLNTVADATTSILQDYHLKASDAALVTSQLVATTGAGKTTFEQLAASLHSVLPIASATHIALSDILGAEASMTVHGMSADQVTQNLSDTIRHLASPTIAQTKYLGQLGISSASLTDMLSKKGLTGTLEYLSTTILSKMGPSGKVLLGTFNASAQAGANVKAMVAGMTPAMQSLAHQFEAGSITSKDWSTDLKGMAPVQANQMTQFAVLEKRATGFSDALKSGTPAAVSYTAALRGAMGDATGLNTALMLTGENTTYTNAAVATISKTTAEAGGNVKGWAEIQATFNVRMAQAREQVEVLGIRVGTALLPYMTKLATALGAGVGWLTKHQTVAKAAAIAIGSLAAAVLLYKTYQLGANVVEKISDGYLIAKKVTLNAVKAATAAYGVVQAALNADMWTWIGVQAIDFAAWVRKTAVVAGNTVALAAYTVATNVIKVATIAWTGVQWLLNAALDANPIGIVVLAIGALIAVIVLIATKTTWFQTAWKAVWSFLKMVGAWFAGPFAGFFVSAYHAIVNGLTTAALWIHSKIESVKAVLAGMWDTMKSGVVTAVLWVHSHIESVITAVKALPARIRSAASGMWNGIKDAFRAALDWVIGRWNGLHFTIPGFHFLGVSTPGFTLGVPHIPMMATGGTVTQPGLAVVGEKGPELRYMPAGASVIPLNRANGAGRGGGPVTVEVHLHGPLNAAVKEVQAYVRGNFHGDVVTALQGHAA